MGAVTVGSEVQYKLINIHILVAKSPQNKTVRVEDFKWCLMHYQSQVAILLPMLPQYFRNH